MIPKVIVLVQEGVRNTETIGEAHKQYIPLFWNEMVPCGTLYNNLRDYNLEFHLPSVLSICTGKIHHAVFNKFHPSVFRSLSNKYNFGKHKMWALCNWWGEPHYIDDYPYPRPELKVGFERWGRMTGLWNQQELKFFTGYSVIRNSVATIWPQWDWIAQIHFIALKKILLKYAPHLMVYLMQDPEVAHADTYAKYVMAIKKNDEQIYEIWNMINTEPAFKENTYLFVCVDHSRDDYYRTHNNNNFRNPSNTWLYVYGPDIKKNALVERPISHPDIFSTIEHVFNVHTPGTDGNILEDCFIR